MRRVLTHRHAPVAATALAAVAYLLWAPATADMAGHTYRAWLFSHQGLTVWNAQWYGGHHVLGYSVAFAPLSVWPGPAWAGAVAAVAAVALLGPLARHGAPGRPAAAVAATWLFALAVLSNLVIGRMPFALGIALAVAAWAALERGRRWLAAAAACALACVLASPVAGAFLVLAAIARAIAGGGRPELVRAAVLGVPVLAGGGALALLFPEGGDDRFVASAFWPMLAVCVAGVLLLAPARRAWWAAGLLAIGMLALSFAVPNTFGQNALRLPVLLGPVALLLAPRRPSAGNGAHLAPTGGADNPAHLAPTGGADNPAHLAPTGGADAPRRRLGRVLRAVVVGALVYLAWLPAVRAVGEAQDDPSTHASFWTGPRDFFARAARPGERVEVAFTHNHWEAAYLASVVPLARGWERQLDEKVNPLFYDGRRLTPARYHRWLRRNAVRWVALPAAPLDYSARGEARILRRGAPFLRLAARPPGWHIYEVRGTRPPASAGARITAAGPDGFDVVATGPTVVREHFTRYWRSRGACLTRAPGGWTRVDPRRAGPVRVRARFGLGASAATGCGTALTSRGTP